jgi:hypothetical protein
VNASDPRILENNDFWYTVQPAALYRDEGTMNLTSVGAVNALTDVTAAQNLSANPLLAGATNFHLTANSPCRNAGTRAGAPGTDFELDTRPQENVFDIGADEFKP